MVDAAEQWLGERNVPKAELMIRRENTAATQFYRRLGYQQESRTVMGRRLDGTPQPVEEISSAVQQLPLIETTVTYLEMFSPPDTPTVPAPPLTLALLRLERPTTKFYLYLYDAVGRDWTWVNRKHMDEDELDAIIQDELVDVYVLYVGGVPAGYAEFDRRKEPDIELAYFGLVSDFIGRGLGKYFLDWAIHQAWSYGPERVWVNTCTEDHPRAWRCIKNTDSRFTPRKPRSSIRTYSQVQMKMIEAEIVIGASPEQVWSVLTDFEKWSQWNRMMPGIKVNSWKAAAWNSNWLCPDDEPPTRDRT